MEFPQQCFLSTSCIIHLRVIIKVHGIHWAVNDLNPTQEFNYPTGDPLHMGIDSEFIKHLSIHFAEEQCYTNRNHTAKWKPQPFEIEHEITIP